MIMQDAQVEFASARRRRAACRVTLTDDNTAYGDSDKQYFQIISEQCLPHNATLTLHGAKWFTLYPPFT